MTLKNLWKALSGKTVLAAVLPLLCLSAAVPAFSQTAEIRSTGVYYIDSDQIPALNDKGEATGSFRAPTINDVYCNWSASELKAAGQLGYKGGVVNIPGHQTNDPWDTSALIEYDQPYPVPAPVTGNDKTTNRYPNHCLGLCFDVYCTNKPAGQSTYSIAFPLQNIRFEIAKYYGSKDINNPETNPAVRTIFRSILPNEIFDPKVYANIVNRNTTAQSNLAAASRDTADALDAYNNAATKQRLAAARSTCSNLVYTINSTTYRGCTFQADCYSSDMDTMFGASPCSSQISCSSDPLGRCMTAYDALMAARGAVLPFYNDYSEAVKKQNAAQRTADAAQTALSNAQEALKIEGVNPEDFMCGSYHCYGADPDFEQTTTCPAPTYFCEGDSDDSRCYPMGEVNHLGRLRPFVVIENTAPTVRRLEHVQVQIV